MTNIFFGYLVPSRREVVEKRIFISVHCRNSDMHKGVAIDNFKKVLRSTTVESQTSNGQDKKNTLNQAISTENFYLKLLHNPL